MPLLPTPISVWTAKLRSGALVRTIYTAFVQQMDFLFEMHPFDNLFILCLGPMQGTFWRMALRPSRNGGVLVHQPQQQQHCRVTKEEEEKTIGILVQMCRHHHPHTHWIPLLLP